MSGRVHAIAGGKGGVGKTTTVANLATALSAAGYDVVGVDVDLGMANLGPVLDVETDDRATIHDVLAGEAGITEATYQTDRGFSIVPGTQALSEYAAADPSQLQYAVGPLTDEYDVVLLDTSAGLSHEVVVPLGLADSVMLVTTPDVVAIRDAAKSGELTNRVGGTVEGVVVNRSRDDEETQELVDELGDEVLVTIPEDAAITMSHVVARTGSPSANAFADLATHLVDVESLEETDGEYASLEPAIEQVDETDATDEVPESPSDGPVPTAAYDDSRSESFFEADDEERKSALDRLRRLFE